MREFHSSIAAALASGSTTHCRCLKLTCADGTAFGFTEHDAPLSVDGVEYSPAQGFDMSEESAALGPSAGEWDLQAALSDDGLREADLVSGKFNGATVETLLVDWADPTAFDVVSQGTLGEVTSRDGTFHAEVRGPFAAFDRVRGRVFSARCDAELGDTRCGIDLSLPAHRLATSVSAVLEDNRFLIPLSPDHAAGRFSGGLATLDGGQTIRIKAHREDGADAEITLWHAPHTPLNAGDAVTLSVGCDKSFATCTNVFGNATRFCGFPFMPGDDFALSYPSNSDGNLDGESRQ